MWPALRRHCGTSLKNSPVLHIKTSEQSNSIQKNHFFHLLIQEFNKDLLELDRPQNLKKLDPASFLIWLAKFRHTVEKKHEPDSFNLFRLVKETKIRFLISWRPIKFKKAGTNIETNRFSPTHFQLLPKQESKTQRENLGKKTFNSPIRFQLTTYWPKYSAWYL